MIAVAYASIKNPATVKNLPEINLAVSCPISHLRCEVSCRQSAYQLNFINSKEYHHESHKLLFWENFWFCSGPVFAFFRFSPHCGQFYHNPDHWIVYRHSRIGFSRCFFRCQKEQGVCVNCAPDQKYFFDLISETTVVYFLNSGWNLTPIWWRPCFLPNKRTPPLVSKADHLNVAAKTHSDHSCFALDHSR